VCRQANNWNTNEKYHMHARVIIARKGHYKSDKIKFYGSAAMIYLQDLHSVSRSLGNVLPARELTSD